MNKNQSAANQLDALIKGVRQESFNQGFGCAIELLKQMLDTIQPPDINDITQIVHAEPPERKPAGRNRDVVVRVLSPAGNKGATQAAIIRQASELGEILAQSSTRHALVQLQKEGRVGLRGKHWYLTPQEGETAGTPSQATPAALNHSNQGGQHATTLV